eukprot:Gb_33212 [translate_table: standard]
MIIMIIWLLFRQLFMNTSPASSSPHVSSEEALISRQRVDKYDVFINHRGPDVKDTIASHIYDLLDLRGVPVFLDREELEAGDDFPAAITEAIASSTVHIAIFSPRYAESSWCLRELALMVKTAGATIIPVFWNVTPEEIRWAKKGIFTKAFRKHYRRYPAQNVDEWKAALNHVSNISGLSFSEFKGRLSGKVVDEVMKKVSSTETLFVAKFPIGLEKHVNKLKEYIFQWRTAEKNVICVGIIGMGGIGKSTLAKALYNEIRSNFSRASYIEDVKAQVEKNGSKHIQQSLLQQLLRYNFELSNSSQGEEMLRKKLNGKDALIVYDNIEYSYQMDAIFFEDVLHPGSAIIVTTRDQSIFRRWNNYLKYELSTLHFSQSKELFCRHAFHSDHPFAPFDILVDQFVNVCKGLPLALEVCSSQLYNQSYANWISFWKRISAKMLPELQSILRASYEQLDKKQKEIFLDIAIFFYGENSETIPRVWEEKAGDFSYDLQILERKCMIKLDCSWLGMHDLFRELGRAIVDEECPKYPGRRSRLWRPSDVKDVLQNSSGTEGVRGLSLVSGERVVWNEDESGNRCAWNTDSFANMKELQLLVLKDDCLQGDFGKLSQNLLFLRWTNFPYDHMPIDLHTKQIRILDVAGGKLVNLWNDQSQLPLNLRELNMHNCQFLNRVPESMAKFKGLLKVNFSHCILLKTIPEEFCYLEALEVLILKYCYNLKYLPLGIGRMKRVQFLDLKACDKLKVLPESFGQLPALRSLYMERCTNVKNMEGSFGNISTLGEVNVMCCGILKTLPSHRSLTDARLCNLYYPNSSIGYQNGFLPNEIEDLREFINLGITIFRELPQSIGKLSNMKRLGLWELSFLERLPTSIGDLSCLERLCLLNCLMLKEIPTTIGNLSRLRTLQICACPELKEIPTTIGNLCCLKRLILKDLPKLEGSVVASIAKLSDLKFLCLSGLPLLGRTPSFHNLSSLISFQLNNCPRVKEVDLKHLKNLFILDLSGCSGLQYISGVSTSRNLSYMNLPGDAILDLDEIKQLTTLIIHVSESFSWENNLWLENLPLIDNVHFIASAIPYVTPIVSLPNIETTSAGQELRFQFLPTSKRCITIIIGFVSVFLIDKFDKKNLPPAIDFRISWNGKNIEGSCPTYIHDFRQSKIGELFNLGIFKMSDYHHSFDVEDKTSIRVSAWTDPLQSSPIIYLKEGWIRRIGEGEEYMIHNICSAFFKEIGQQRLLSDAQEHVPSQLNLLNLHALDIANCRIQRLCLLDDTPIQVEEMELVYKSKQLLWGNDTVLNHLDLSIVDTNLQCTIKSMANLYKMKVMISSKGKVVCKDELQEYDKYAFVNGHDEVSFQAFRNILKSRELLRNEIESKRNERGKKREQVQIQRK